MQSDEQRKTDAEDNKRNQKMAVSKDGPSV
jgi:hypothetical protein